MAKKKQEKPKREFTRHQLARWQQQKRRQRIILGVGILVIAVALVVVGVGWYVKQFQPLQQTVISVNGTNIKMGYYLEMLDYYRDGRSSYAMYADGVAEEAEAVIKSNELMRQEAEKLGITVTDREIDDELESRDLPRERIYRDLIGAELLTDKLLEEHFDQQVPVSAEQRHIVAMLLEDEDQASEARLRLEAGEDFAELADELSLVSLSEESDSDLGWRPEGVLSVILGTPVIDDYAFGSGVGVLSQPLYDADIPKNVGYWLLKVSERDEEGAVVQGILLGSEEEAQEVQARLEAGEDFAELADELSQWYQGNGGELGKLAEGGLSSDMDEFIFDPETELETVGGPFRDETSTTTGGYWLVEVLEIEDDRQIEESDRDWFKYQLFTDWFSAIWDDPETIIESYLDGDKIAWAIDRVTG